jgi:hypothetical protein
MVSIWWLVAAFVCGGGAGLLLASLIHFSERMPRYARIPESSLELDMNPTQW